MVLGRGGGDVEIAKLLFCEKTVRSCTVFTWCVKTSTLWLLIVLRKTKLECEREHVTFSHILLQYREIILIENKIKLEISVVK